MWMSVWSVSREKERMEETPLRNRTNDDDDDDDENKDKSVYERVGTAR